MHWLCFLIIGAVAGRLSGKLARGHGFGLVGRFLFRLFGFVSVGVIGSLVSATVGAIDLLWLIRHI